MPFFEKFGVLASDALAVLGDINKRHASGTSLAYSSRYGSMHMHIECA